jgi:hypothetical protein
MILLLSSIFKLTYVIYLTQCLHSRMQVQLFSWHTAHLSAYVVMCHHHLLPSNSSRCGMPQDSRAPQGLLAAERSGAGFPQSKGSDGTKAVGTLVMYRSDSVWVPNIEHNTCLNTCWQKTCLSPAGIQRQSDDPNPALWPGSASRAGDPSHGAAAVPRCRRASTVTAAAVPRSFDGHREAMPPRIIWAVVLSEPLVRASCPRRWWLSLSRASHSCRPESVTENSGSMYVNIFYHRFGNGIPGHTARAPP